MRILSITGERSFGPGNERYELQKQAVDELAVVFWGRRSLWPRLPAGPFDVVTVQDPFWRGLYAWYVAKKFKASFNVQVHTDLSVYRGLRHILMQIILRHADSIRAVSDKIREQIIGAGARAPVRVLPIFVDVEKFKHIVRQPHSEKHILWIGRFEKEKNPIEALAVLKTVRETLSDVHLTMIGDGSLRGEIEEQAKGLSVVFPGWQSDLSSYFANADVVLSTSLHESWGASIIEALAAGIPVVAPDVGIVKEAGAIVIPREKLAQEVGVILRNGRYGELRLKLRTKNEWVSAWRDTLKP